MFIRAIIAFFLVLLSVLSSAQALPSNIDLERFHHVLGKTTTWDGPNCWGTTLYLLGLRENWSYTGPKEFENTLETSCTKVSSPKPGDVVSISEAVGKKWEVFHAFIWIDDTRGLSKENYFADNTTDMTPLPKVLGWTDKNLRKEFFRCSNENSFLSRFPQEALQEIHEFETELAAILQNPNWSPEPTWEDDSLARIQRLYRWTDEHPKYLALMESAVYQWTAIRIHMKNGVSTQEP